MRNEQKMQRQKLTFNRGTRVSDQSLSFIGEGLKDLKSLTKLTLILKYSNLNISFEFDQNFYAIF